MPLPVLVALLLLASLGGFDGAPDGLLETLLFALYWGLLLMAAATWIWSLAIIRSSPLLTDAERTKWTWLAFFGNVFTLPAVWWRLIRPAVADRQFPAGS